MVLRISGFDSNHSFEKSVIKTTDFLDNATFSRFRWWKCQRFAEYCCYLHICLLRHSANYETFNIIMLEDVQDYDIMWNVASIKMNLLIFTSTLNFEMFKLKTKISKFYYCSCCSSFRFTKKTDQSWQLCVNIKLDPMKSISRAELDDWHRP